MQHFQMRFINLVCIRTYLPTSPGMMQERKMAKMLWVFCCSALLLYHWTHYKLLSFTRQYLWTKIRFPFKTTMFTSCLYEIGKMLTLKYFLYPAAQDTSLLFTHMIIAGTLQMVLNGIKTMTRWNIIFLFNSNATCKKDIKPM